MATGNRGEAQKAIELQALSGRLALALLRVRDCYYKEN